MPVSLCVLAVFSLVLVYLLVRVCRFLAATEDENAGYVCCWVIMFLVFGILGCVTTLYERAVELEKAQVKEK